MSRVELTEPNVSELEQRITDPAAGTRQVWTAVSARGGVMDMLWRRLESVIDVLNRRIGFGNPDNGDGDPIHDNIAGQWVTVSLVSAQLGNGASAPVTVTHNLNQPVITNDAGDSLPNVYWDIKRVVYGDRTGFFTPPAASLLSASSQPVSACFKLGDAVTEDAIELRFFSDLAPDTLRPLSVDLFLYRGVQ